MSISKITAIFFLAYPAACLAADLPQTDGDGWYSWRVAVVESAPELCCFSWNNGVATQKRCNLDGRNGGFSIDSENPFLSDEVQIYARMDSGSPAKIRVLSSQCPVTTESAITDLGIANVDESVEWLTSYISPHTDISDEAITAIAMHAGDKARDTLIDVAGKDDSQDNRENAIFWMAQVRIAESADEIKKIMFDDSNADIREHAAFSYSQSTATDRATVLIRQGKEDANPDVRSQAWFWLTQTRLPRARWKFARQSTTSATQMCGKKQSLRFHNCLKNARSRRSPASSKINSSTWKLGNRRCSGLRRRIRMSLLITWTSF